MQTNYNSILCCIVPKLVIFSNKSNLYFTFQDYLRDLEKEEEEQKKIQKVLLCLCYTSGCRTLLPSFILLHNLISVLNQTGRIEKDGT